MKIRFFLLFLIFSLTFINSETQNNLLRFDLDLKTLSNMDRNEIQGLINDGVVVAIDGLLSSITHSDYNGDGLIDIVLTIVNGKWQQTESIEMYQCEILLKQEEWSDVFPERLPRDPGEDIIQVNSYMLIMGSIKEIQMIEGKIRLIINGQQLRKIS